MKAKFSTTFEFDIEAPVTVTGEVEAGSLQKLVWRAADEAKKQRPNIAWRSFVVVLERL